MHCIIRAIIQMKSREYYKYFFRRQQAPVEISLLPLIPSFSFSKVLIDFLTIIKYRKKDINNIGRSVIITQYTHYLEMGSKKPDLKFIVWDLWIYDHILF
jgi:hypothetical protein